MIPVTQTRLHADGEPPGNCFAACLASIMETSLDDVPQPGESDREEWSERYWQSLADFVHARGFELVQFDPPKHPDGRSGRPWTTGELLRGKRALCILSGPGPRGTKHAVVGTLAFELVHDPHPSRAGLLEVDCIEMLVPIAWPA